MITRRSALARLAACLLACAPAAAAEPAAPSGDLPGVDTEGLSSEQKATLAAWAKDALCYCGCPHTVSQCLREHGSCRHAKRMASLAARLLRAGARRELSKTVDSYYASFDRRARLDVSRFGPPLGNPAAPIALVEFSDFTCPYCQAIRSGLEAFVRARANRVKLFYKPFPIESHPGALECAQAAEWAREKGQFWAMHDAVFGNSGAHTVDDLADLARSLGLVPAELRDAISDKRYVPRIRESQGEARAAGIRGTPTLFLDGRMLVLTDYSEEGLTFTLEDEEEWRTHHGWNRD
ncbi:MAG TPA: thioredoxin domain-containing protein [Anaeromyxobacter sp.]